MESSDLEWLFSSDEETDKESKDVLLRCHSKLKRVGRPSIVERHPEIVSTIKAFIDQSTSAAHLRRRNNVYYTNGVTLKEIADHVMETCNIKISRDTVHRMMLPVRNGTINSKRFKSLIPARVPPKKNSGMCITHPDFHYTSSQISLVNQLAQLCHKDTVCLSVDNKNKVEVGIVAANRRCNIRKFYLEESAPNYNDHDFPYRNSKLVPAGYQLRLLRPNRSRSISPPSKRDPCFVRKHRRSFSVPCKRTMFKEKTTVDRVGRSKVVWPRTGPLNVQLYPSRSMESTSIMHMNFLLRYIHQLKKETLVHNVVAIADGGPDWAVKGTINLMAFGYLWQHLALDTLTIQCFAPGHSRFNPIERSWSYLTKCLVGVELQVEIEELDFEIPAENDEEQWDQILNKAVDDCGRFWNGKKWDSFPITVYPFYSNDPVIPNLKLMHAQLKSFKDASKKKISSTPEYIELQKQYIFFVKHCNRKAYQLEFCRCDDNECMHCSSLPSRDNLFLEVIKNFGGSLPSPVCSDANPEHYKSLEEMLRLNSAFTNKINRVINNCTDNGFCPYAECNFAFFSVADTDRHFRLMGHDNKYKPVTKRKNNNKRKKHGP